MCHVWSSFFYETPVIPQRSKESLAATLVIANAVRNPAGLDAVNLSCGEFKMHPLQTVENEKTPELFTGAF